MLTHRLSEYRSPEQNRMSPRIAIQHGAESFEIPERFSEHVYASDLASPASIPLGRGYRTGSGLIKEPMEFADNNRISLMDLMMVVQMITRPDLDDGDRLGLSRDDRAFLMDAMGQLPRESQNPVYDPAEYPDEWGKFLLPGVRRVVPGERVRIYNKIGRAYGTSTDAAYVLDTESGRGVFVGITMYTNDNAILNDNVYEYESLADPAMADIGAFIASRFLLQWDHRP